MELFAYYTKMSVDCFDHMAEKSIFDIKIGHIKAKLITYKNSKYENIYCQTNSQNAQEMSKYLDKTINQSKQYGEVDKIIIVKNQMLQGIAGYDYKDNYLYISEELIDEEKFKLIVNSSYFPARNIEDVLNHELGGHKRHWESIYAYQKKHGVSVSVAKQAVEDELRKYVVIQNRNEYNYIKKYVSENAYRIFEEYEALNELIADVNVLHKKDKVTDEYLFELVKEMLDYDD